MSQQPFNSDYGFSTTANVVAGNVLVGRNISAAAYASPAPYLSGFDSVSAITLSASGNVTAGNVSVTGNITSSYFLGNGSQLTGVTVSGTTPVSTTGNVSAGNLVTAGTISANNIGNIASINLNGNASTVLYGNGVFAAVAGGGTYGDSNVNTLLATWGSNTISTTGNITSGYLFGNGSQLTGLPATYGNTNVATFLAAFGSNSISTTGNITTGNLVTGGSGGNIFGANNISANTFSASGNVTAGGLTINGTGVVTGNLQVQGTLTYNNLTNITTPNLVFGLANTSTGITANGAGFVVGNTSEASFLYNYSAQAWNSNIGINAVGNVAGGNLRTAGLVSATGNIAGNYIIGNGSQLTGVTAYTNANVSTFLAAFGSNTISTTGNITGGNIDLSYMGGAAKGNVTGGNISMSGNITGGNIATGGLVSATGSITTGSSVSAVGTVTGANLATGGTVSATANITGGNVATGGIVSATANITGGNLRTGGSVSATGSLTGGNIFTAGNVSATGNTTSGNILASATISTGGNIFAGAGITAVGTIAGSNLNITGLISATGNTTAGNVLTAGQVSATGNITTANSFVGNLVGTTASMTGNVSAGNVIVNGQPTTYGVVNPDYINAGRITSDQTGAGQGSDIIFNYAPVSSGISLNTSTGVFTLTAGKTYQLFAELSFSNFSDTANGYEIYDWVDATTNTRLSTTGVGAGVGEAINRNTNEFNATSTTLIYTPTTNQTVKVRIVEAAGTVTVRAGIGTKAIIQQINPTIAVQATATGTVNNQYSGVTLTSNQVIGSPGTPTNIVFQSATGTVPYNTSTGVWTLTSGVTYNLTAVLAVTGASNYLGYQWVDSVSGTALSTALGFATLATTQVSSVPLSIVYTPNTNQTIVLRNVNGQYASVIANYSWATVTQINQAFALNALATMSVTGNITTTGNVSATGNVTAANFFGNGNTLSNVATQVTGSWTVPVGNSTQSFTVSSSNTYYMWVDCNISNGILVWNATATVTNTNVPVVGAQYAWVYNGGGTPIDFTSIPNQFVGTSNTIVRSSTAPSATTNRFDFGINNTSGNAVTVRYGYTKIS